MKFHGIDMRGKFHVQRVSTLPVFESTDKGRLIYVEDEDEFYFGGTTEWKQSGGGATSGLVGMIAAFPAAPPDDWVVCDGSTIQAADYPELVRYLTNNITATSAQLPDYRGYFLRGWDSMGVNGAALVDGGRSLNSVQGDANKAHAHSGTTDMSAAVSANTSGAGGHSHTFQLLLYKGGGLGGDHEVQPAADYNQRALDKSTSAVGDHAHSVTLPAHSHSFTTSSSGGVETRPKNISVIYAIRAK